MKKTLTTKHKRELKIKAALLNPIVLIGNKGLTEAVHHEINRALNDHELIKIRFHEKDKAQKKLATAEICTRHQATFISSIGHVIVIFRPGQDEIPK